MRIRAPWLGVALGTAALAGAGEFTLDDFEDGDRVSKSGPAWVGLSDGLMGQGSEVRLSIVDTGAAAGGRKALRVEGDLADRFAGAWVALEANGRAVDLRAFSGVRLRVRGPAEFTVGLRGGGLPFVNFTAPASAGEGWSEVEVPFSALRPSGPGPDGAVFDPQRMRWFGVSWSPLRRGAFRFEVDAVAFHGVAADAVAALPVGAGPAMETRRPGAHPPGGSESWPVLVEDRRGDGRSPALPDARRVRGWRDPKTGVCWLRVELASALAADWVGMNLLLDLDGDAANGSEWWGVNKELRFDRLVTAWVFDTGASYQGVLGVADAADVARFAMMNPALGTPEVAVDFRQGVILVGVPPEAVGRSDQQPRGVVAVGSAFIHNDDIPDAGSFALPR